MFAKNTTQSRVERIDYVISMWLYGDNPAPLKEFLAHASEEDMQIYNERFPVYLAEKLIGDAYRFTSGESALPSIAIPFEEYFAIDIFEGIADCDETITFENEDDVARTLEEYVPNLHSCNTTEDFKKFFEEFENILVDSSGIFHDYGVDLLVRELAVHFAREMKDHCEDELSPDVLCRVNLCLQLAAEKKE